MASPDATIKLTSKIRFWIGDTTVLKGVHPNGSNFSDEELTQLLTDEGGDPMRGVAAALEILANTWAAHAGELKLGPESETSSQADTYAKRSMQMRQQYGFTPKSSSGSTQNNGGFNMQVRPAGA